MAHAVSAGGDRARGAPIGSLLHGTAQFRGRIARVAPLRRLQPAARPLTEVHGRALRVVAGHMRGQEDLLWEGGRAVGLFGLVDADGRGLFASLGARLRRVCRTCRRLRLDLNLRAIRPACCPSSRGPAASPRTSADAGAGAGTGAVPGVLRPGGSVTRRAKCTGESYWLPPVTATRVRVIGESVPEKALPLCAPVRSSLARARGGARQLTPLAELTASAPSRGDGSGDAAGDTASPVVRRINAGARSSVPEAPDARL
jgi:hypothetical protein